MSKGSRIIIGILMILIIVAVGLWIIENSNFRQVNNHNIQNGNEGDNINNGSEENNVEGISEGVSKFVKLYIKIFDDIIERDSGLNGDMDFISIDFNSIIGSEIDTEQKEIREILFLTEEEKDYLIEYMKKYNDNIKTNTYTELKEEGRFNEEIGLLDGILIYANEVKKIDDNKYEISLVKYRGVLGAIFPTYELTYENDEWNLKVIREAVS